MSKPLVSVVVLSWNTLEDTQICIESIRHLDYPNTEIVVVDNGSSDGSKEYLAKQKDIIYIDLPENTGFTGGQLAAFEKAQGKYLVLINSDSVISPDWLDIAIKHMQADPQIGAIGGRAYTWQDGEKPYATTKNFYSYQIIDPKRGYATTLTTGEKQVEVDSISGAGVLINCAAIKKVGYFDNRFFAYFEETDLFARMQRAGYKIIYEPSLKTWHKIAQSTKGKPFFYLYQMHRNRFLFAMKNFDRSYVFKFFWFYVADGIRAFFRYLLHRELDNKARVKSLLWAIATLPSTLRQRREVMRLGASYSHKLAFHSPADDITVVIPCYNYAQYVGQAIESVLKQTLKPYRIIVIDDGSTDNSREVISKYKDRGVELVTKNNGGVISTKNLGIEICRTSWTIFLDADDILEPNYLEIVYKRACSGQYNVVYTDMKYFGFKDMIVRAGSYNFYRFLGDGNYIHNSALISTYLLKQVGGYKDVMLGGYEDWELYITLAEVGAKFGYVAKPLLLYRQHEEHSSRNVSAEVEAKQLWHIVHKLHIHSFRQYEFSPTKLWRMTTRAIQNPLVLPVAVAVLPLCLLAAIKAFFVTFGKRFSYRVRHYLHKRDEIKRQPQVEEDQLWPDQPH